MNSVSPTLQFPAAAPRIPQPADRLMKLRDAEFKIRRYVLADSMPSRGMLIRLIEDGTLDGKQLGRGRNWFVTESSVDRLIEYLTRPMELAA